ncbi:MAG TPA: flagellar basal body P-ring formation chaperone FlgA [Planctomycetota bacterium]|nr:flagellar basal body P-ring formation chaperone FlgA [Planctomycetota bacterium]
MLFASIMLCFTVATSGGQENGPGDVELRIKPTVSVRGLHITIGELCEISPMDGPALAMANVRFGQAPVDGFTRTIGRSEIVQALAAAGQDVSNLKFTGADEIVVQSISVDVPSYDILDAATAALQAQLTIEGGDVEYEAPTRIRQLQAPPGHKSQEIKARVRGPRTGPNSAVVDVEILVDGETHKKVPVQFKLQRYHSVLKTTGTVRAGEPLGPDNLTVAREPMDQATGLFLDAMPQIEGQVASHNLQAGQRLTLGDAAPPAVVHRGDVVTVVLTSGRVKVTSRALANHDAPLAGRITLTSLQSRSTLTGIVGGPGLVIVQQ